MDFQKAFDSVWKDVMLNKLSDIDIEKYLYNAITNILSETEIALKIDHKHSEYFKILRGVKQGDSISPTLFKNL